MMSVAALSSARRTVADVGAHLRRIHGRVEDVALLPARCSTRARCARLRRGSGPRSTPPWTTRRRGGRARRAGRVHSGTAPTLAAATGQRAADRPSSQARPAVPTRLAAGPYARCHGRHVQADRWHLPGQGQQGSGQGRRPPRHARPLLREAAGAAPEGAPQRGRRGHGPQAHRAAGPGLQKQADKLQTQAKAALQQGNEDLAREALSRRAALGEQLADLKTQHDQISEQEQKLVDTSQQLQTRVEQFRTKKETLKASYTAAEAQTKVGEAVSGISDSMGNSAQPCSGPRTRSPACRPGPVPWTSCWPRVR